MFIKTALGDLVNVSKISSIEYAPAFKDNWFFVYTVFDLNAKREKGSKTAAYYELGLYNTFERAQEVLDDIYNAIARGDRVYTMPEE